MRPRALDRCELLNFGGLRTEQGGKRPSASLVLAFVLMDLALQRQQQAVRGFSVDFQNLQFRGD